MNQLSVSLCNLSALALIAGAACLSACSLGGESTASAAPAAAVASVATTVPDLVQRGEHLVLTAACHDCHTPLKMGANGPEPDLSRMLSGHPEAAGTPAAPKASGPWIVAATGTNTSWAGPWGVSRTANLTPDNETGLGAWTEEQFIATFKTGRHQGRGREILPPMPIPAYRNFSVDELKSIFAYLRTIPPVKNRVPDPTPPQG
jgi:mono/diheme cytochrome c family protein